MTITETPRLLLDYPETARVLNVGRTTVYKLVDSRELTAVKIGKRSLITAESVEAYVTRLAGAHQGADQRAS